MAKLNRPRDDQGAASADVEVQRNLVDRRTTTSTTGTMGDVMTRDQPFRSLGPPTPRESSRPAKRATSRRISNAS